MATWQFDIDLIPQSNNNKISELKSFLDKHIGNPLSLIPNTLSFGAEDGNRVDLFDDLFVFVRIDMSNIKIEFLDNILDFCNIFHYKFEIDEQIIEPNKDSLKSLMIKSDANKFVKDPESFLKSLL